MCTIVLCKLHTMVCNSTSCSSFQAAAIIIAAPYVPSTTMNKHDPQRPRLCRILLRLGDSLSSATTPQFLEVKPWCHLFTPLPGPAPPIHNPLFPRSAQAEEEEEEDDDETTEEFLGGGTVVSTDVVPAAADTRSQAPPSRSESYSSQSSPSASYNESREGNSRDSSSGGSNGYQRSSTASVSIDGGESSGEPVRTREENMAFYNGGRSTLTKPRSAGPGGEGGMQGGRGAGRSGSEPFRGQRMYMTEEQLAKREESSVAVKGATTWRELANVLAERAGALDAEHISNMLTKVGRVFVWLCFFQQQSSGVAFLCCVLFHYSLPTFFMQCFL